MTSSIPFQRLFAPSSRWRALSILTAAGLTFGAFNLSAKAETSEREFAIKNGDRVLFYGDSITEQNLYNTLVETYIITRFPQLKVDFQHAGWGGDSVHGGGGGPIDQRLERDVFTYKPTVMTIMLGMNDGHYHPFDQVIFDTYLHGYEHILDRLENTLPQTQLYLIEPSAYDDVTRDPLFPGGYNAVLMRFSDAVREQANERHHSPIDLNTPVVAALTKANQIQPALALKLIPDRIHPGPAGHLIMACAILEAWHAPKLVSFVSIDATSTKIAEQENTTVSELAVNDIISWQQLDTALPFPINERDPLFALADRAGEVTAKLNQEILKVTGLRGAEYELVIDGQKLGHYSSADLSQGVNLATLDTPMYRRADEIYQLSLQHNRTHYVKWRSAQLGVGEIKTPKVTQLVNDLSIELDAEEAEMVRKQHALAQTIPHRYQLTPVAK